MIIRPAHDLAGKIGTHRLEVGVAVVGVPERSSEEIEHRLGRVEVGHSLVEPAVALLVGAYDHRHPHVADLVGGHPVQRRVAADVVVADQCHHRELHAAQDDGSALDRRHMRPGVGVSEVLGEEPYGVLPVARRVLPARGGLTPERLDAGVVRLPVPAAVADGAAGRIPERLAGGAEGEVAHVGGGEAPHQTVVGPGARCAPRAEILAAQDADDLIAALSPLEAFEDPLREDLARIAQLAGGAHDPAVRDVEAHLVVGETHVELAHPLVGIGMPADHIVIDRHLRVPVGDEEEVVGIPSHAPGPALRYGERPLDVDPHRVAGHQRLLRPRGEQRALHLISRLHPRARAQRPSSHGQAPQLDAPGHLLRLIANHPGSVQVLVQVQVEDGQGVGRAVVVDDLPSAREASPWCIQCCGEPIAGPLLPVVQARLPRRGAGAPLDRRLEPERRHDRLRKRPLDARRRQRRRSGGNGRSGGTAADDQYRQNSRQPTRHRYPPGRNFYR